jgi:hypothetical protein
MSFSVCLDCFRHGALSTFPRIVASRIFGDYIVRGRWGLELWYGNEFNGIFSMDDEVEISGVAIDRPGDQALHGLYELARLTPSVIYWNESCVVADAGVIPGVMKEMLDGLGSPTVVHSGQELIDCIARS